MNSLNESSLCKSFGGRRATPRLVVRVLRTAIFVKILRVCLPVISGPAKLILCDPLRVTNQLAETVRGQSFDSLCACAFPCL